MSDLDIDPYPHDTNIGPDPSAITRHQIQHYTGQLAKDTSKQLQELNGYPPEQALDPR